MKVQRILILGFFAFTSHKKDGQTVKTRQYLELLKRNSDKNIHISTFDTEILHIKPWKIADLLWKTLHADKVIYMPAHNTLRLFFPTLSFLSRLFHFEILYVLIGGWLPVFLENRLRLMRALHRVKQIFPETETVKNLLESRYGLRNITLLPNFRFTDYTPMEFKPASTPFRLVFLARITREKGIDIVFRVLQRVFEEKDCPVQLDFYGEINAEEREEFLAQVAEQPEARYGGVLLPENIIETLAGYDAMILPTRYPGEGFPGCIIEAYMAGIPDLITDFRYAFDCVEQGKTGFVIAKDDNEVENYVSTIKMLYNNGEKLREMKRAAFAHSKVHGEDVAWSNLKPFLA